MDNKKTGALYIRVSTDKQEELSPDAQIRECLSYAKKNDIHVPADYIFRDDGISGRKADKRPAFQELIGFAKSKEHPIDCIIVWKYSRFARNQEESIVYKSLLQRIDVDVLSVSEPLIEGPFGSLIERIIEWMDEYYSTRLSGEVIRGMTENAMRGKYQADPPIGYKHEQSGLPPVKDPETLPVVENIVKWFLNEHLTCRAIALRLNNMGYRSKRGNLYDARAVRYILENPFYCGRNRWNYTGRGRTLKKTEDVIYSQGNWEPLYSEDTFQQIQSRLSELDAINKRSGRRMNDVSSYHNWLSGIVVCSSCGRTLANNGGAANPGMNCWGYIKGMCKESHYIRTRLLEDYVTEGLESLLSADNLSYSVVHSVDSGNDREQELSKALSRLDDREKRAKAAYLNGIDSLEEYKEVRQKINIERSRLTEELAALVSDEDTSDNDELMIENIRQTLDIIKNPDAADEDKGIAIRGIIDKIVFDRKNTSFDFHLKLVK